MMNSQDTICALATPNGIGAIAIVRLSGSQAKDIAKKYHIKVASFFKKGHIISELFEDEQGFIWIGYGVKGLVKWKDGKVIFK